MNLAGRLDFWQRLVLRDMEELVKALKRDGFTNENKTKTRLLTGGLNNLEGIDHFFQVNDKIDEAK